MTDTLREPLDRRGFAVLPRLLDQQACESLRALYGDASRFRARIVMARHGFGRGEYQYFADELPPPVAELRQALYRQLSPIANQWAPRIGIDVPFEPELDGFLARCHAAGQTRPTPLLLRYGPGDHNCLHQDLYGALAFPLQVAILLSQPEREFTGGEFVLTEQRPRQQSVVSVVGLNQGDAVAFAVNQRPVQGARGTHRVTMRHGVSEVRSGERLTLGIIFHDAR